MIKLPTFECYCSKTTSANALRFDLGEVTVWYSYQTPVAIALAPFDPIVRRNEWGPTTGKHLNAIDGGGVKAKALRVGTAFFEEIVQRYLHMAGARLCGVSDRVD